MTTIIIWTKKWQFVTLLKTTCFCLHFLSLHLSLFSIVLFSCKHIARCNLNLIKVPLLVGFLWMFILVLIGVVYFNVHFISFSVKILYCLFKICLMNKEMWKEVSFLFIWQISCWWCCCCSLLSVPVNNCDGIFISPLVLLLSPEQFNASPKSEWSFSVQQITNTVFCTFSAVDSFACLLVVFSLAP